MFDARFFFATLTDAARRRLLRKQEKTKVIFSHIEEQKYLLFLVIGLIEARAHDDATRVTSSRSPRPPALRG